MRILLGVLFFYCLNTISAQDKWNLQQCIDYAKENNLSVINSRMNEEINQSQVELQKSNKLPSVNASFNNGVNFGFQPTALGIYEYNQSYSNSPGFDANIQLFNKGRLYHQIDKAELNTQIQQLNTESIIQDISLQIASLYLQIILNKELESIAQEQVDNTNYQLDKTRKLYEAGSSPYANLVEQEAKYAADLSQLETSKINVQRAEFNLAIFLQLEDYEDFKVEDFTLPDELQAEYLSVADVIETAIERRPEVKQAEMQVMAAEKDIEIAKMASWPSVDGGYNINSNYFNFFDIRDDGMFKQWYDNHNQRIYVRLNIPIFNRGNKLNVQQAILNRNLIRQNIDQQKLQLTQDIQTAYFDANAAYQQYINLKTAYESAAVSEGYAEKSYNAGRISIYDLNIQRTNTIVAKSQMVNANYDYFFKL